MCSISRESAELALKLSFDLQSTRSSVDKVITFENATSEENQKIISAYQDKLIKTKSIVENLQLTPQKDLKLARNFDSQWKNCDDPSFCDNHKAGYEFVMSRIFIKIVKSVGAFNTTRAKRANWAKSFLNSSFSSIICVSVCLY
ncbi:MAG: hypothetical protein H7839_18885 [Magnetococcus sp. YQC-5]